MGFLDLVVESMPNSAGGICAAKQPQSDRGADCWRGLTPISRVSEEPWNAEQLEERDHLTAGEPQARAGSAYYAPTTVGKVASACKDSSSGLCVSSELK